MISWGCKMNATQLMQFVSYYLPDKKIFFQLTVFNYFLNKKPYELDVFEAI